MDNASDTSTAGLGLVQLIAAASFVWGIVGFLVGIWIGSN